MPVPSQDGYEHVVSASSPDAWWHFKDSVGSSTLTEAINSKTATLTNPSGVVNQSREGMFVGSIWSSGYAKSYFYQPSTSAASIEVWIKTTATTGEIWNGRHSWIDSSTSGRGISMGLGNYGFGTDAGKLSLFVNSDNLWVSVTTTNAINDGNLHHVVGVWSSSAGTNLDYSQFSIYIDGVPATVTGYNYNTATAPLSGNTNSGGSSVFGGYSFGQFSGWMSELAFYSRALTSQEIANHYQALFISSYDVSVDALVQLLGTGSFSVSAKIRSYTIVPDSSFEWPPPLLDAIILVKKSSSFSVNSVISYVITRISNSFLSNASIRRVISSGIYTNAYVFKPVSFSSDPTLLLLDTFSRTTSAPPWNVGLPDIGLPWEWTDWDTLLDQANDPIYVDGSHLVAAIGPSGYNYSSMHVPASILEGTFKIDYFAAEIQETNASEWRWLDNTWGIDVYQSFENNQHLLYVWGPWWINGQLVTFNYAYEYVVDTWLTIEVRITRVGGESHVEVAVYPQGGSATTWTVIQIVSVGPEGFQYNPPGFIMPMFDLWWINSNLLFDNISITGYLQKEIAAQSYIVKRDRPSVIAPINLDATISRAFKANSLIIQGVKTFTSNAVLQTEIIPLFVADAIIGFDYGFMRHSTFADAYIYKPMIPITFTINAYLLLYKTTKYSYFFWATCLFGTTQVDVTFDAEIIGTDRTSSTTVNAWMFGTQETWGSTLAQSWLLAKKTIQFLVDAKIIQKEVFRINSVIRKNQTFTSVVNALIGISKSGSATADAVIYSLGPGATTQYANTTVDAALFLQTTKSIQLNASIYPKGYFISEAWLAGSLTINAVIQPSQSFIASARLVTLGGALGVFPADAYLKTSDVVIWPIDGTPPPIDINRSFRIAVKLGVPTGLIDDGKQTIRRTFNWIDITQDVVFGDTYFTQRAKTGPGEFSVTLKGSFAYASGAEIRLEVDDFVQFGGIVSMVEHGYFFPDSPQPKTVLHGTDYNILFDQLFVFNPLKETLGPTHTGAYRPPVTLPVMTPDNEVVAWLVNYIQFGDLNYTDYVEYVDIANRFDRFFINSGETFRTSLTALSNTTNAVWYIDALKNLHYHSKFVPSPGIPAITDLGNGISSSNMRLTGDISNMVTEDIVWGTLARTASSAGVAQGGTVTYAHYTADGSFLIQYAKDTIAIVDALIAAYEALPSLTPQQQQLLAMYIARRDWYYQQLAKYEANPTIDSRSLYGWWQRGEFRDDLHRQGHVNTRAVSILYRWYKPVNTVACTIWEPGFTAGAVATVTSWTHGFQDNLVIREVHISFPSMHGQTMGFPRYDLQLGVEPESPWNIYDMLPIHGLDGKKKTIVPHTWVSPMKNPVQEYFGTGTFSYTVLGSTTIIPTGNNLIHGKTNLTPQWSGSLSSAFNYVGNYAFDGRRQWTVDYHPMAGSWGTGLSIDTRQTVLAPPYVDTSYRGTLETNYVARIWEGIEPFNPQWFGFEAINYQSDRNPSGSGITNWNDVWGDSNRGYAPRDGYLNTLTVNWTYDLGSDRPTHFMIQANKDSETYQTGETRYLLSIEASNDLMSWVTMVPAKHISDLPLTKYPPSTPLSSYTEFYCKQGIIPSHSRNYRYWRLRYQWSLLLPDEGTYSPLAAPNQNSSIIIEKFKLGTFEQTPNTVYDDYGSESIMINGNGFFTTTGRPILNSLSAYVSETGKLLMPTIDYVQFSPNDTRTYQMLTHQELWNNAGYIDVKYNNQPERVQTPDNEVRVIDPSRLRRGKKMPVPF